jgi:deoxyribonuclease V
MSALWHSWDVSEKEAVLIQDRLASVTSNGSSAGPVISVAGCDVAYDLSSCKAFAAVCVFTWPGLSEITEATAIADVTFPYVPGLLAFREGPVLLKAFDALREKPGLVIFNGQGIAHPRRMGLATHLGMILDVPSIGCARKNLYGTYHLPANEKGAYAAITCDDGVIGACLRTRKNTRPVFISRGYRLEMKTAVEIILGCTTRYRMPEPLRAAHMAAGEARRQWMGNADHHNNDRNTQRI